MYEPFFGMERRPFSATPDPGCFYSSSELQTVLDELTVCVERGQGIGILTASAGIGKTLLCQRLAADLRARDESGSQFECVYLSNSNFPTRRSLLQAILFEMGDEYSRRDEPELRIDLRSRLLSLRPQREALVLIVDEAHLFADELLEELRTLSDLADEGSSLVRIVLSGQHDLEERLTDRSFDALNQRIS
ncbi:MAG: type II secretory pathway predicted ATPase ExeA, partial [Porticoccaceae bacterium]